MSKIHKFTTPGGEAMVILPEAEYKRLVEAAEDASDITSAKAIMDRVRSGTEEVFPADVAERLVLGDESPVHVLRKYRGITGAALAEKAGISRPYLTQIETGQRHGSAAAMKRIAAALGVDVGMLV